MGSVSHATWGMECRADHLAVTAATEESRWLGFIVIIIAIIIMTLIFELDLYILAKQSSVPNI